MMKKKMGSLNADENTAVQIGLKNLGKQQTMFEDELKLINFKIDFEINFLVQKEYKRFASMKAMNETELKNVNSKIDILQEQYDKGVEIKDKQSKIVGEE